MNKDGERKQDRLGNKKKGLFPLPYQPVSSPLGWKRDATRVLPPSIILLLILTCTGLHFYGSPIQAQLSPKSKITIAHATPFNSTPVYVAVKKGYFKPELDVSLQGFPAGKEAFDEFLKGKADLATVAEMPFIYAVTKGAKASIIATISETTNSYVIIGPKDRGFVRPGDLRSKKIGIVRGTAGEFFLYNVLLYSGIPRDGVKQVHLPIDKMLNPLLSGEVDAVVSWEPFAHQLLKALGGNAFAYYGAPTYNRYTWNLVAQKSWIDQKPETVRKVIQALVQGVKFVKKNPSEARKILAEYSQMDESEANRIWGSTVFKVALHPSLLMILEDQARWAIRGKLIEAKTVPNFLNHIYFDGLTVVDPAAVTIAH